MMAYQMNPTVKNLVAYRLSIFAVSFLVAVAWIGEAGAQKVRVAMLQVGESKIELLEPTSPDSPVAKFLEKSGPGIHHIAYEVANIEAEIARLQKDGVRMIDAVPRHGAHGTKIAFVHPKSSTGVLTELCQSGR